MPNALDVTGVVVENNHRVRLELTLDASSPEPRTLGARLLRALVAGVIRSIVRSRRPVLWS